MIRVLCVLSAFLALVPAAFAIRSRVETEGLADSIFPLQPDVGYLLDAQASSGDAAESFEAEVLGVPSSPQRMQRMQRPAVVRPIALWVATTASHARAPTPGRLFRAYLRLLAVSPTSTKVATASVLAAAGDMVAQLSEAAAQDRGFQMDVKRAIGMIAFAASYTGLFQSWWICALQRRVLLANPIADALVKTWLCQGLTIPLIYMPSFFFVTGVARGEDLATSLATLKAQYADIYKRNVCYWVPVQMFQFLYLARDLQVPFLCAAGFTWNVILSRSNHCPAGQSVSRT